MPRGHRSDQALPRLRRASRPIDTPRGTGASCAGEEGSMSAPALIDGFAVDDLESDPAAREAELARLRREDPVHRDARNGFWLLTKHSDVREASKQPELFSSQAKGPWHLWEMHFSMQALDGPEHRRQRAIVSRGFTPRMVRRLAERARATLEECIDAVAR